jgi:hypothetical protein
MKVPEKRTRSSGLSTHIRVPRLTSLTDTAIAIILYGLGIYHFTQPNQAWRSGTAEIVSATLLLIAGYRASRVIAILINLVVAVVIGGAGIRHLIHGGGWRSGIVELFFAVTLIAAASMIHRHRKE